MGTGTNWHGKPYYSLDAWCKNTYGHKCYRVALNAHMTCPNRDGSLGVRGCIFCSAGGSGDFAVELADADSDISLQLEEGIRRIEEKLHGKTAGFPGAVSGKLSAEADTPCIIAYFQAYTNTYAPVQRLEQLFTQALLTPRVCGISVATRPDCLPDEVLALLTDLKRRFPDKFIWVELGLQTIHEKTAVFLRRGYALPCFETAARRLSRAGIPVIVHIILGLPGEDEAKMLETIRFLNGLSPFGIKLQLLHVLEGTDLAACYRNGTFDTLTKDAYLNLLIRCLEELSPEIVLHRVTGDGPGKLLIAPLWSRNKKDVLNSLHRQMQKEGRFQGRLFSGSGCIAANSAGAWELQPENNYPSDGLNAGKAAECEEICCKTL